MKQVLTGKLCSLLAIILSILLCSQNIQSQDGLNFVQDPNPSSPTAASFAKYGNIPVGHFTGVPNISVPLTSIQSGPLSLDIGLSYHASGIKVEEVASWVGLGWSLNAGGVISRVINGGPDEGQVKSNATSSLAGHGWYKGGTLPGTTGGLLPEFIAARDWLQNEYNGQQSFFMQPSSIPCNQPPQYSSPCFVPNWGNANNIMTDAANGNIDTEPDMFNFSVAGVSGKFFFDELGNAVQVNPSDVKIEPIFYKGNLSQNNNSRFIGFTITDTGGTEYEFTAEEKTYNDSEGQSATIRNYTNSSWYLTKITSAYSGHTINLTYVNEKYSYPTRQTHNIGSDCQGDWFSAPIFLNLVSIEGKRLSQISSGDGLTVIDFIGTNSRQDLSKYTAINIQNTEAKSLDEIVIKKGTNTESIELNYGYYTSSQWSSNPSYDSNTHIMDTKRLKLLNLEKKSGTATEPYYEFFYESTQLPRRLSLGRDHWGYFNGQNGQGTMLSNQYDSDYCPGSNTAGTANREISYTRVDDGSLITIKYATGGSTSFTYEPNKHGSDFVGGLRIKSVSSNPQLGSPVITKTYDYLESELYTPLPQNNTYEHLLPLHYSANGNNSYQAFYVNPELEPYRASTTQGYHIGYKKVKETLSDGSYSIYEFHAHTPNNNIVYPRKPVQADPLSGTLWKQSTYDGSANLKSEVVYNYVQDLMDSVTILRVKPYQSVSNSIGFWNTYSIPIARKKLVSELSMIDGVTTSKTMDYYNTHNHIKSESITNSDGDVFKTEFKYPKELDATLAAKNILGIPLEKTTKINGDITGGHKLIYANFGSKRLLNNVYRKQSGSGTLDLYQIATDYNDNAQIVSSNRNYDITKSIIWRNKGDVPIAVVNNAEKEEIAYSGFEQALNTTEVNGGWTITGAETDAFINTGGSKTGNYFLNIGKVYNTGGGGPGGGGRPRFGPSPEGYGYEDMVVTNINITKPITVSGLYVVSYWAKYNSIILNGVNQGSYTTDWRYEEKEIYLNAGSTLTIGATGNPAYIDELRLMPADAQMTTYNYDRNTIQPISFNDLNSKATHYEYDHFKRLAYVIDHNGNYLNANQYHYQTTSGGAIVNYIKSYTAQVENLTANSITDKFAPSANTLKFVSYFDGLGRSIQSVGIKQSPTNKDIITSLEYDSHGREWRKHLTYTYTSANGAFTSLSTAISRKTSFLTGFYGSIDAAYGYTESKYEISPLNRIIEQSQPGDTHKIGSGHSSTTIYRGNTANEVWNFKDWTYYPANSLNVVELRDGNRTGTSNGSYTYTYTDKVGRQIASNTAGRFTYNVYDNYGRLHYVIPPKESGSRTSYSSWSSFQSSMSNKIYKYTYDVYNRMITKDLPAQGLTSIYYDRLDRVVMTKDANGLKSITKYDILSRPALTGLYTGSALPSSSMGSMKLEPLAAMAILQMVVSRLREQ